MGGACSSLGRMWTRRSAVDESPREEAFRGASPLHDHDVLAEQVRLELEKMNDSIHSATASAQDNLISPPTVEIMENNSRDEFPVKTETPPRKLDPPLTWMVSRRSTSSETKPDTDAKSGTTKVSARSSLLDKAGNVGILKAVQVREKVSSKITDLNADDGCDPVVSTKGTEISILAFEVANTIVRGFKLMGSLSKENVLHLKEVVLHSVGVQLLVSNNMDELLKIVAADKREELNIVTREVIRFGNCCKDSQWHNLDRIFERPAYQKQLKEKAEAIMQQLITMVHNTADLYHEWQSLDKVERDYQQRHQEKNASQRETNLRILRKELKIQKKQVKSLKKRSLWSKTFEEVIEKLVDVVNFLKLEIKEAFGDGGTCGVNPGKEFANSPESLGSADLALHYANVISKINTLMLSAHYVPRSSRDMLYQALPPNTKSVLRSKLQSFHVNEELSILEIKAEMTKITDWLVPMANSTTMSESHQNPVSRTHLNRIETLHHASKERTESYILDLVLWLQHLVSRTMADNGGFRSPIKSPIYYPTNMKTDLLGSNPSKSPKLAKEDLEMQGVSFKRQTPVIRKSHEFERVKTTSNNGNSLSKSGSHSSNGEMFQK